MEDQISRQEMVSPLSHSAHRPTDALVAIEVMGWTYEERPGGDDHWRAPDGRGVPVSQWLPTSDDPYTGWNDIRRVIERMRYLRWGMVYWSHWPLSGIGRGNVVTFYRDVYPPNYGQTWMEDDGDKGMSFPVAVCRAALRAVRIGG